MTKIIDMYRTCQYDTAEQALDQGGMYNTIVHHDEAIEDVIEAITNACDMMDGGYTVVYRVRDPDSRGAVPTTGFVPLRREIGDPT